MKYPDKHYAPEGIQHTRCVVALTVITLCMELYQGKRIDIFTDIKVAVQYCVQDTKKKKLSGGAKRAIDNCSIIIADHIDILRSKSGEGILRSWAILVWCALTFMEDAVYTCPYFTDGISKKRWEKLLRLVESLAESLRSDIPGIDEGGTYLYEKAAWALDGVAFKDMERETLLL